jgi:hypothetical protein
MTTDDYGDDFVCDLDCEHCFPRDGLEWDRAMTALFATVDGWH